MSPAMVAYEHIDEPWEEPPTKKRRFFISEEDTPVRVQSPPQQHVSTPAADALSEVETVNNHVLQSSSPERLAGFDQSLLETFIGETLSRETVQRLRELAGDDIEKG